MSGSQIRAFMLPLTLAVMPISTLSAQSVKDYERAAIEKLRRERAAEAETKQRLEQEAARRRAQAEQAANQQRARAQRAANEEKRKAAIAEAQRQERMRREKEALRRAALCQQAVEQKDQPRIMAECAAAAELGSRISAVHFGVTAQSQQTKDINLLNKAVNLLLANLNDHSILEDPNGELGPPRAWGEEVEILLADILLDHEDIFFDYATASSSDYTSNGLSPRQAIIGIAYNIYVNSDLYKSNLIYKPKYKRAEIFFKNKLRLYPPPKKIDVIDTYRGEQILSVKDARPLASRESMYIYFDPYAKKISCHREGELGSWSKRKCDFVDGKLSAAEDSRGVEVPYWIKIAFITECDLTYYPNPQRNGYSYCTFRIEPNE